MKLSGDRTHYHPLRRYHKRKAMYQCCYVWHYELICYKLGHQPVLALYFISENNT